jgi:hypothetical protein
MGPLQTQIFKTDEPGQEQRIIAQVIILFYGKK